MADFLESTNININSRELYGCIKKNALAVAHEEVCGLILKNSLEEVFVLPCENIYKDRANGFMISPEVFLSALNKYEVLAVYHSHVDVPPNPSGYDLRQSESLCLPFVIYSVKCDDLYIHIPESFPVKDLTGRVYVDGLQNCITLVVDFYRKNYDFKFNHFNFYLKREDLNSAITFRSLLQGKGLAQKNGFTRVRNSEMQAGDVIMFQSGRNQVHLGVYLEGEEVLHHPFHGLSVKSFFNQEIKQQMHSVYRKSV